MSNSGVNTGFAKCFILFIAILTLVQGGAYLGLSIWGLDLSECDNKISDISSNPFKFAMDLIYFSNQECGVNVSLSNKIPEIPDTPSYELTIDWTKAEVITDRTHIFLITYAVISALWVLTSLIVIVTICIATTKLIIGLVYWPWFIVIFAGSIVDAVATGFFIKDIINTTSFEETANYIGLTVSQDAALLLLQQFDSYYIIPAVVMTCVSSRVVLVWILNIFGSGFCLSLARGSRNKSTKEVVVSRPNIRENPVQYNETEQRTQLEEIPQNETIRRKPTPLVIPQSYAAPMRSPGVQSYEPVYIQPTDDVSNANTPTNAAVAAGVGVGVGVGAAAANTSTPERTNEPRPISSQFSLQSPLNNRYSGYDSMTSPGGNVPPSRVSAELRSQLPWSYTSTGAKPVPPPKPQPKVYPDIPEPDYATPTKTERPDQNSQNMYSRW